MYYLYVLSCSDKSLYTGITNNLAKRMKIHRLGKGSKYVFAHLPFKLVYTEIFQSKSKALKRELEIKKWKREEKIRNLRLKV